MNWKQLLSSKRLGKEKPEIIALGRSPFQQDYDRIVFSSAFRRMQDKAQVFPLAANDYVRTRLTHSMEVSCIGRSLGAGAGVFICENNDVGDIQPSDVGAVVAAASLAHDIGNPPLGHSGEEAIRHWFCNSELAEEMKRNMTAKEQADIERYEGNAQGFRVLSRLQMPDNKGGMQLTCATLGAFTKYPVESFSSSLPPGVASKKFNFFQLDRELFAEVAETTGLIEMAGEDFAWCRHPLAFLVEAADDMSYRIVDFEDGHILGIIDYHDIKELFLSIIKKDRIGDVVEKLDGPERKIEFLRAKALGTLVGEVIDAFKDNHDAMLAGEFESSLIDVIPSAAALEEIQRRSVKDVYTYRRAVEIEAAGFELTEGLLDAFVYAVNDVALAKRKGGKGSYRSRKLLQLIPERYCDVSDPGWLESDYVRLMNILDYISGMTDSYAVSLFKKIKGISLPGIMM
jgi:dGTPase